MLQKNKIRGVLIAITLGIGILSYSPSYGQAEEILDSLLSYWKAYQGNYSSIDSLNEYAWQNRIKNPVDALTYVKKAVELSKKNGYEKGKGEAFVIQGLIYRYQNQLEEAEVYFQEALTIRKRIKDVPGIASVYNNLGLLAKQQAKFQDAEHFFLAGLQELKPLTPHRMEARLLNNLGSNYRTQSKLKEAIEAYNNSLLISEYLQKEQDQASTLLNIANLYSQMRQLEEATKSIKKSQRIYFSIDHKSGIAKTFTTLGDIAFQKEKYFTALEFFDRALEYKDYLSPKELLIFNSNRSLALAEIQDDTASLRAFKIDLKELGRTLPIEVSRRLYNIGQLYLDQEVYDSASYYFHKSLSYQDTSQKSALLMLTLFGLSRLNEQTQTFDSAYHYNLAYNKTFDKIRDNRENVNFYRKDLEIALYWNYLKNLAIGALFFFLIASLYIFYIRRKQKKTEVYIDRLLQNQELELAYAKIEGQDETQRRIAQDLHDRLGSMLSTIKLYFASLEHKLEILKDNQPPQYLKATEMLDEACDEVRRIAHNMQSGVLVNFGLKAAISSLTDTIKASQLVDVNLSTFGLEDRLPSKIENQTFKIIQELLGNALKHAQAKELTVQINHFPEMLNVIVEDDGVGFQVKAAKKKGGMGLSGLEARVHDLQGTLEIDSGKGNGTTISIDIPLNNN